MALCVMWDCHCVKIALFNVKYSPNLGDGLLSECLERELRHVGIDAVSIDLAGRDRYARGSAKRGRLLAALEAMPAPLRLLLTRLALTLLATFTLRPAFRRRLRGCKAVVVGGGNLFADADLNFPIKVHAALDEARGLPGAVFAVGVASNWSGPGRRLFRDGLAQIRLVFASVRDARSQALWDAELGGCAGPAMLVCDPGLLASRHYPRDERPAQGRTVGLCITDPVALRYHGGGDAIAADMDRWYGGVGAALADGGWAVRLFTNGSPEDRDYLDRNIDGWQSAASGRLSRVADFATPAELVRFISGCDLLIGHRMHACIAAHSFAVPTVLLKWDPKLESFCEIAGRLDYFVDPATTEPAALADIAAQAHAAGVDRAPRDALIERARADVASLAEALKHAVASGR